MAKWYGSITNRIDEGHNYNEDKLIHEGDDITEYFYSDCHCWYVTKVINQKDIFVKPYQVCADHSQPGGMGHQNWLYFKTVREEYEYLNSVFPDRQTNLDDLIEPSEHEWVYRYKGWFEVTRWNLEKFNQAIERARESLSNPDDLAKAEQFAIWGTGLTADEITLIKNGKTVNKYHKLQQKISFGVRHYYYDWEF